MAQGVKLRVQDPNNCLGSVPGGFSWSFSTFGPGLLKEQHRRRDLAGGTQAEPGIGIKAALREGGGSPEGPRGIINYRRLLMTVIRLKMTFWEQIGVGAECRRSLQLSWEKALERSEDFKPVRKSQE